MDEPTKLSPKLLAGLLKLLKSQTGGDDPTPEALLGTLSAEQQQAAKQMLNDPQKLQNLLQHPQVQSILRALQKSADGHGDGRL